MRKVSDCKNQNKQKKKKKLKESSKNWTCTNAAKTAQHNWILNSVLQEATVWHRHRHIKQLLSYLSSLIYTLNCVRHRNALIFRFLAVYNSRAVQIHFHVWKSFIENGRSQLKVLFFSRCQRSVLVRCQQLPKVLCDKLVRQWGAKVYHSFLREKLYDFLFAPCPEQIWGLDPQCNSQASSNQRATFSHLQAPLLVLLLLMKRNTHHAQHIQTQGNIMWELFNCFVTFNLWVEDLVKKI